MRNEPVGEGMGLQKDRLKGHCTYGYKVLARDSWQHVQFTMYVLLTHNPSFRNLTETLAQMHESIRMRMLK